MRSSGVPYGTAAESILKNAEVSAERRNGQIVGNGPFGRFGRHLVQNRNNLGIHNIWMKPDTARRPALADRRNDCCLGGN